MSYTLGEGLILTKLQAITASVWTSTNTARGKWTQLNSGANDHYAVLKQGDFTHNPMSLSMTVTDWETVIELWVSYTDDGTSYTNLLAYQEAIRDQFDAWRKLGDTTGTVQDARLSRGGKVEERWVRGGGPRWLKQDLIISWKEENVSSYAE